MSPLAPRPCTRITGFGCSAGGRHDQSSVPGHGFPGFMRFHIPPEALVWSIGAAVAAGADEAAGPAPASAAAATSAAVAVSVA